MPVLLTRTPDGRQAETPLGDRVLVGRSAACDLRLDDTLASRRHAEVRREQGRYVVRDLGSRNGTFVNGTRVREAVLECGDAIVVGHTRLLFVAEAPSALVGTVVADCEVLEVIGSGGMGVVYRARQQRLDRIVALKVLHPRLAAREEFIERFLREAHAAGALNHPNLIHVHDAGHWDPTHYYILMECVPGPTVAEELRRRGVLEVPRAAEVALQVAAALGCAHARGIVHRDVKPANIMLARDGTAKLADLGIATTVQETEPERTPDGRPRVLGTPAYIAPEVATGGPATPRSDLYSLGATLFHMLAGRVPFPAATSTEALLHHVRTPLPMLQEVAPQAVPRALARVVERLMAKRPERRYPSAEALRADLRMAREIACRAASDEETRPVRPVGPGRGVQAVGRWLRRWLGRGPRD